MQLNFSSFKWLILLPFLVLLTLVIPKFVGHGMFVDGVMYATIGRNMALGLGSLWAPHYTDTVFPFFTEHPPLSFFIQSLAFRIFPDVRAVEQVFTLTVGLFNVFLIGIFWKLIKKPMRIDAWLPRLLFVMIPIVFWNITNNELENQVILFTLSSAILATKALSSDKVFKIFFYSLLAFLCIVVAFLIKGVFGLYPLVFPFFLFLFISQKSKLNFIISNLIFLIGTITTALSLYFYQPSRNLLFIYFRDQVFSSLAGKRKHGSVPNLEVLKTFAADLAVPVGFCLIFYVIVALKRKNRIVNIELSAESSSKTKFLFLSMALSASLPLMMCPKYNGWYMMISMPFFALFIADIFEKTFVDFKKFVSHKALQKIPFYLCLLALIVTVGRSIRNWERVLKNDVYYDDFGKESLSSFRNQTFGMCADDSNDWAVNKDWEKWTVTANLARDYNMSIAATSSKKYMLYMVNTTCFIPLNCFPMYPTHPKRYVLYQCDIDK